jgi:hypothetical protein
MLTQRLFFVCAGLLLLGLVSPPPVGATGLDALVPGMRVRLRAQPPGSPWVTGRVVRLGDGKLALSTKTTEREFFLGDLLRLDANPDNRSRAGRGALFGGFAGSVIGMAVGSTMRYEGSLLNPGRGDNAVGGAILGGLTGLVAGALVGSTQPVWERVRLDAAVGIGTGGIRNTPAVHVTMAW